MTLPVTRRFPHSLRLITLAATLCALSLGAVGLAAPTRLQVLVSSDPKRAEQTAKRIDHLGYGPALVEPDATGKRIKVFTRAYDSLAEANFAKPQLKGLGFADAFAVEQQGKAHVPAGAAAQEERKNSFALPLVESGELFGSIGLNFSQSRGDAKEQAARRPAKPGAPVAATPSDKEMREAYRAIKAGDLHEARRVFQFVRETYPDSVDAGEASMRLAYICIALGEPAERALSGFLGVAEGKVTATKAVRLECALRAAALYHRGKDLPKAHALYGAAEAAATSDPNVQAFAATQRAGLTLEEAWNGKRTFAEARSAADSVARKYPAANDSILATAAVMAIETLAYEENYTAVQERESAFLTRFDSTEEAAIARYWFAKGREKRGDWAGAAAMLEPVLDKDGAGRSRLAHGDLLSAARAVAGKAHAKLGNTERATELKEKRN